MIGGVSLNKLKQIKIIQPPLNEQKRIVEKLDKMMRIVDDVNARLNKIPTALKRARQSILNQAITGELTKDWREKENIEISLIPKNIYELGDLLCGASPKSSETNVLREGIPYVSGPEQWDGKEIIVNKWTKYPKKIAPNNSIFITVKGAGVGKIFPGINAAIGRDIYAFVPNETINYSFLMLYLQNMTLEIINKAQGLIPGISKKHILQNTILLPPLEEQAEIVRRVKLVFEKLDKIELRYQKAKEYSDKLTQSILNKAFRGELVPQDPNDKPISLDDIQVQIAEKPSKKRKTLKNNKVQEMVKEIIEILKEYPEGISPEELFKNSKYSQKDFTDDDIIEFYKELSNLLDSKLTEEKDSVNHKILIKKVK